MGKRMIAAGRIIAGVNVKPLMPGSQAYLASGKRVRVVKLNRDRSRCFVEFYDCRDGALNFWVDKSELSPR